MVDTKRLGIFQCTVDFLLMFKGFFEVVHNEVPDDAKVTGADYDLASQTFRIRFETKDERFPFVQEGQPVNEFIKPVLRWFSGETLELLALSCWERLPNQGNFRCKLCNAVKEVLDQKLRVLISDTQDRMEGNANAQREIGDPVPPDYWHTDTCPIGLTLKNYGGQLTYANTLN